MMREVSSRDSVPMLCVSHYVSHTLASDGIERGQARTDETAARTTARTLHQRAEQQQMNQTSVS